MTAGITTEQDHSVAWARDIGINHFDTAASFGNTTSESNLGRAPRQNLDGVMVSTEVRLNMEGEDDLAIENRTSLKTSLRRLKQALS